jgi:hypothetical protein
MLIKTVNQRFLFWPYKNSYVKAHWRLCSLTFAMRRWRFQKYSQWFGEPQGSQAMPGHSELSHGAPSFTTGQSSPER